MIRTVAGRALARNVCVSARLVSTLSVSEVRGPSEPPITPHTMSTLLRSVASEHGGKLAVVSAHQNKKLSYNELDTLATRLAHNLYNRGVRKGDNVAVCCGNRWEFLVIQMGLGRLGAVLVPLNTAFTDDQYQSALNHCKPKVLISQRSLEKRGRERRQLDALLAMQHHNVFVIGESFNELLEEQPSSLSKFSEDTHNEEVVNMQFTSGTTSAPKLSALTHRNIINNGLFIGNRMGLTATQSHHPSKQDHLCIPVPMFHCFGLVLANLAAVSHGCCLVYPSETFDPERSLQAIRDFQCTGLYGVPTMFAQQLELVQENDDGLRYLSKGIAAGSSIPVEMMKKLISVLRLERLTICYGMTETSPVSFMTSPDDTLEKRTSSVGKVMPHTLARVVSPSNNDNDSEQDQNLTPLPVGTAGEIIIAGYLLQKEYHQDPVMTAKVMVEKDGVRWMRTGDEGVMDAQGFLTVTGRIKDLIIKGGENIHPLEIENVLFAHPKVSQASVVASRCNKYGEDVAAFVILHHGQNLTKQELQEWVKCKLGSFYVPKHVAFVDDYPKTASGKIRKIELRNKALEMFS